MRAGYQQRIQTGYEIATLEISEALSRLKKSNNSYIETPAKNPAIQRCIVMPATKTSRFFDRVDIFLRIDEILASDSGDFSLQSVALHGLPGVGKTSIAWSYAEKKFSEQAYDVVLWVLSENEASIRQSMTDVAIRLKLPGAQPTSHAENQVLIQEWFRATSASSALRTYEIFLRCTKSCLLVRQYRVFVACDLRQRRVNQCSPQSLATAITLWESYHYVAQPCSRV